MDGLRKSLLSTVVESNGVKKKIDFDDVKNIDDALKLIALLKAKNYKVKAAFFREDLPNNECVDIHIDTLHSENKISNNVQTKEKVTERKLEFSVIPPKEKTEKSFISKSITSFEDAKKLLSFYKNNGYNVISAQYSEYKEQQEISNKVDLSFLNVKSRSFKLSV